MNLHELKLRESTSDRSAKFWPRVAGVVLVPTLFGIIPVAFLVVALQLTKASGPQWLGSNFENSYMYLFNSLLVAKGEPPYQFQHPGTTTELFGAVCLRFSGQGSGETLINAVLDNPEPVLKGMHRDLLVLCALAVWIFPLLAAWRTWSVATGLLLQAPLLFYSTIYSYSIWYSSDLLLIVPSIATISICIILIRQREEGEASLMSSAFAGVMCGFGVATKFTFFPLILVAIFCCRGLKRLLAFAVSLCIGAALALIPIYSELSRVSDWVVALATHSGRYGSGEVGLPRADVYIPDIVRLISTEPAVLLVPLLATAAIVFIWFITRGPDIEASGRIPAGTAVGIFFVQMLSFLFIAKHASPHYLIPLYVSTGLNLALLYQAIQHPAIAAGTTLLVSIVLGVLLVSVCSGLFIRTLALAKTLRETKHEQLNMYARVKERTERAALVEYYRSNSPEFALYFGNSFAGHAFARQLEQRYPHRLFLCIWNGYFDTFNNFIEPSVIMQKYEHLYFFGNRNAYRFDKSGNLKYFSAKGISDIYSEGDYVLQEWVRP